MKLQKKFSQPLIIAKPKKNSHKWKVIAKRTSRQLNKMFDPKKEAWVAFHTRMYTDMLIYGQSTVTDADIKQLVEIK